MGEESELWTYGQWEGKSKWGLITGPFIAMMIIAVSGGTGKLNDTSMINYSLFLIHLYGKNTIIFSLLIGEQITLLSNNERINVKHEMGKTVSFIVFCEYNIT